MASGSDRAGLVTRLLLSARPLLIVATLAAIGASWLHLVGWMARFETASQWWVAALAATAVDVGLLAALRLVGEQSGRGRRDGARDAKLSVVLLVSISFAANVQHALTLQPGDWLNAVAVAGVLPLVAIVTSHLYDVANRNAPKASQTSVAAPVQRPSRTPSQASVADQRAEVQRVAAEHPEASRRELARLAGTSDTTVRRMIEAGELRQNGHGWEAA